LQRTATFAATNALQDKYWILRTCKYYQLHFCMVVQSLQKVIGDGVLFSYSYLHVAQL